MLTHTEFLLKLLESERKDREFQTSSYINLLLPKGPPVAIET